MVYDADQAGEMATLRGLDLFLEEGMNVKVATLTQGEDPDSFIRKRGVKEFSARIDEAKSLFDYKINVLLSRYSHKTVDGKEKIIYVSNPVSQNNYHIEVLKEFLKIKNIEAGNIASIITLTNRNSGPEKWRIEDIGDIPLVRPFGAVNYIKNFQTANPIAQSTIDSFIKVVT